MNFRKNLMKRMVAGIFAVMVIFPAGITVHAEPRDYQAEMEARKSLPIQTNEIPGWPAGPAIGAQSAILMDADTGAILYAKNIDEQHYPASITKVMTTLLAIENCELDEMVTFSHEAIYSIERGSSNIGMDEGESITMNQALQGILILSANEVANAVGEHVAGTIPDFVDMMNAKAAELGCTNTHFANANGLHDDNHFTTARDMATIARSFFSHDVLCNISSTTYCTFEATATQPDSFSLATKNQLVKGKAHEYPYLVGSKTGFTSISRQTLVSCAKKDGLKLICVVFVEESPYQFTDTIALFDYGFENFTKLNIAEFENRYTLTDSAFFEAGSDIFGNSQPILSLDNSSYVVVPKGITYDMLESELSYGSSHNQSVATIRYTYHDNYVGETYVKLNTENTTLFDPELGSGDEIKEDPLPGTALSEGSSEVASSEPDSVKEKKKPTTNLNNNALFINVKPILLGVACFAGVAILTLIIRNIIRDYHFSRNRREIMKRRRNRRSRTSEYDKYNL